MNVRITFRGMEHSDSVENYAHKELGKLSKYLQKEPNSLDFDLVLEADKHHTHHKVELRLKGKGLHLVASREGKDLYQEIYHVIKIMGKEVKKHKEKMIDKRNNPGLPKDQF